MNNVLVTGGAGFIGVNFVRHTLRHRPATKVVVLDALTYAGNLMSLDSVVGEGGVTFVHGDIRDQKLVESLLVDQKIDTIVHFAAESHVDRSIAGPDAFLETNVFGTHALLKAARARWLGSNAPSAKVHFHHVSTDEVYGTLEPGDDAFRESTPYAPNSPYAATKAASDHLVRAYHRTYGLPVTTSNCSNNYGPFQFPEKLIPLAVINALEGKPIPVYGDGLQSRDWLYVEDHCRAVWQVVDGGVLGETYNIGGGTSDVSNLELLRTVCEGVDDVVASVPGASEAFPLSPAAQGRPSYSLVTHVRDRPGHDRRYAIDYTKAARDLGYAPTESLATGLRKTILWYVENEEWWRRVVNGEYRTWVSEQYGAELA